MRTRPELLLLQKTMVVVEGVARTLDPKLDMWSVADPVVREWIQRNLGPAGKLQDAAEGAGEIGRFLGQVPALLTRAGTLIDQFDDITRNGLVLAPETVAAIGKPKRGATAGPRARCGRSRRCWPESRGCWCDGRLRGVLRRMTAKMRPL